MNSKNTLSKTRRGKAWPRTIIVELVKRGQLPRIEDNRENECKNTKTSKFLITRIHFFIKAMMDEKKFHIFCLGLRVFLSDEHHLGNRDEKKRMNACRV
jgi:hypothetical protein